MIISGAIDTGIPDITVVIRENSDANRLLVDVPNLTVNVQQGPEYNVSIQPSSLVIQRTGSLPSLAISAYSASYALTASYIEGGVTLINWDEITNKPSGIVSSSQQYPGWVTASSQIDYNQIRNRPVNIVSSSAQVKNLLPIGTVSSSIQINTGSFSGSITTASHASYAVSAGFASVAKTLAPGGTFAIDNLVVSNSIISPSITSSLFGTASFAETASYALNVGENSGFPFSGSAVITGSLYVLNTEDTGGITGSLYGTASVAQGIDVVFAGNYDDGDDIPIIITPSGSFSYVTYADTASYLLPSAFVQNAVYAQTASYFATDLTIASASYATTALFVLQTNFTGSFTGSFFGNFTGSTTIPSDGLLVLEPRNEPINVVPGALFFSTSGELYLGT